MTKRNILLTFAISIIFSLSSFSQAYHVRIGFIGNSITIGSGLSNPAIECYPYQIGLLLKEKYGDTCVIKNFAVSGRTMLKKGDFPIWNESSFSDCWAYAPDICFICMGTNDSKPYNWDVYGDEFYRDYKAMIDTFVVRNPATKFIFCLPPPAFDVVYDIRNPVIVGDILPLIDSIAKATGADVIDFYHPLVDSISLFPDKIHPSAKGAKVLAKIAFDEIDSSSIIHKIQTGHSFVTSLKSSVSSELRLLDKATLSWSTINANEVLLNGTPVGLSGSILISPSETTSYTLVARGESTVDSLIWVQKVYTPNLTKITVSAIIRTIKLGTSCNLKMNYYDQLNKAITDSVFAVNWSVIEGSGHFINQTNTTVQFVGDAVGSAIIRCSYGNVSYSLTITVTGYPTILDGNKDVGELYLYPNPFNEKIYLTVPAAKPCRMSFRLYDMNGKVCQAEILQIRDAGTLTFAINTSGLASGTYLYKVRVAGFDYSGKLIKE